MNILGISCYYHDSAAVLFMDSQLIAASEEERFTRIKHDKSFPINSIDYCLTFKNLNLSEIDAIVFYDNPTLKLERILESLLFYTPFGFSQFLEFAREWLVNGKWNTKRLIETELKNKYPHCKIPKIITQNHHQSHAASAYYPSPFKEALIFCLDGVGEWTTTSIWHGKESNIELIKEINFPHSLGMLYSCFTHYLGFKVNDGEYKLMGLSPYGEPIYKDLILKELIDVKDDGSFCLNMKYFTFTSKLVPYNTKFEKLFSQLTLNKNSPHNKFHADIAASIQAVTEDILLKIIESSIKEYQIRNICLAGGVAHNCVANGKIIESHSVNSIWIQPASGDSGGAIGACYTYLNSLNLIVKSHTDQMSGSLLGPEFSEKEINDQLINLDANFNYIENENELFNLVTNDLIDKKVIGWFQSRAEFGPRALGNRSIIADPRSEDIQNIINSKIKFRESFRPFAPAILNDEFENYFISKHKSLYMSTTCKLKESYRLEVNYDKNDLNAALKAKKSIFPGITHVDYSARVQSVDNNLNPKFYNLIRTFKDKTNCPLIINTSFNIRGEPIVSSPTEAYRCFMNTDMDILVIGNFYLKKNDQKKNESLKYQTEEIRSHQKKSFIFTFESLKMDSGEIKLHLKSLSLFLPLIGIIIYPLIKKHPPLFWTLPVGMAIYLLSQKRPNHLKYLAIIWK